MEFKISKKIKKEVMKKHEKCKCVTAICEKFTYSFTPTGIGIMSRITCNVCGKTENTTDYDEL